MNPLITRWKTVPSYRRSLVRLLLRGSVHSRLPSASSTKLATVLGAWLGNSCRRMSPWLVDRVAYRSSATALLRGWSAGTPSLHGGCDGGGRGTPVKRQRTAFGGHSCSAAHLTSLSARSALPTPGVRPAPRWRRTCQPRAR